MPFCVNCGAELTAAAKFCPECGTSQIVESENIASVQPEQAPAGGSSAEQAQAPTDQASDRTPPQTGNAKGSASVDFVLPQQQQSQPSTSNSNPQTASPAGKGILEMWFRAWDVLKRRPIRLWGLSLMYSLLCFLASIFGVLPIISIPIQLVLNIGVCAVYLDGIHGREVNSDQLFMGFHSFWRYAGGMGWMLLWIIIWGLIPIVGIVFAIIKTYSYCFTPYIMLTDPEITGPQALRKSMQMTKGSRGKMFGASVLPVLAVCAVYVILALLASIPVVGLLFALLILLLWLLTAALMPLFLGLVEAAFYDEAAE